MGAEERRSHDTVSMCAASPAIGGAQSEHLREYINEYLTDMSQYHPGQIPRARSTKYIGDAIMAF